MVSTYGWRKLLCLVLMVILSGCGADNSVLKPPPTFTATDLIGTWKTVGLVEGTDTLVMRADHTFTQRYTLAKGAVPTDIQGTWRLEPRASGCVYVHLEGMRYMYETVDTLKNGNRSPSGALVPFREWCEQTFLTMPDKVILSVGNDPKAPRGMVLRFPCASADCLDYVMELVTP